jgi:hypothetical protein
MSVLWKPWPPCVSWCRCSCRVVSRGVRFNKVHKRSLLQRKRKAILQPRGLFDFVSPFIVFVVYAMLYGKKSNPFETHARRVRTIGLVVKSCVYSYMACVAFVSLNFTLGLLDWQRWEPFALRFFHGHRASQSHRHDRATAPARGGWVRLRRTTDSWKARSIRVSGTSHDKLVPRLLFGR